MTSSKDGGDAQAQQILAEKRPASAHDDVDMDSQPAELERWSYVLAGFLLYLNTSGTLNTFGVYQAYYQLHTLSTSSPSAIAWIGSVQVFIGMALGIFTGPLYDRGYFRPLVCAGSSLTVLGMMTTSIASSYYQVFLAQGVCVGLGMGCTYVPILAAVSMRFTSKRRPIALGLCSTGACVGGTVLPIMLRQLIPKIGFAWAVRSVAFVNLGCACLALLIVCRRPNHAYPARRLLDLSALREPPYALFTLAMFLIFLPYYVPLTYIPLFAQTALGASDNLAGYLLAIANGGSLFGRTMPYILGTKVTPMRVFVFWAIGSSTLLFGWIGVTTIPGFILWCVLWGFVSGALVTAPIASISHCVLSPSPAQLGTRMGMSWFAAAAGELVGAPVAGALANVQAAQYTLAQAIPGAIMVVGTLCLVWPYMVMSRSDVREKARAVV